MAPKQSKPSPEHIFQTLNAHQQTSALKAAIELDLFTAIDDGHSRASEIAKTLQVSERGARILSDYLTVIGFLKKDADAYSLGDDAALFLSKRSPHFMGSIVGFLSDPQHFENLAKLSEAVRRGGTASNKGNNQEPNDPLWVSFARSMAPLTVPAALFIASLVKPDQQSMRVLDIAAGHGMYGITVAQQHQMAHITALDWPAVLEVAKENAKTAGIGDRYTTRPGSAFETDFGENYDLVLLTNILHHFDKPTCIQLIHRVHKALRPGGTALTLEFVPNEDRVSPPTEAAFSLLMLVGTDAGDAYTLEEYRAMFREAGFPDTTLHRIPDMPQEVLLSRK